MVTIVKLMLVTLETLLLFLLVAKSHQRQFNVNEAIEFAVGRQFTKGSHQLTEDEGVSKRKVLEYGEYCYNSAKSATEELIGLNKRFWDNPKVSLLLSHESLNEGELLGWVHYIVSYYKKLHLKKEKVLDHCNHHFINVHKKVDMKAVSASMERIKQHPQYHVTEKDLQKMSCTMLTFTVIKMITMFNQHYMPIANTFIRSEQHSGERGYIGWLELMLPYWMMMHEKSPAAETCFRKYNK